MFTAQLRERCCDLDAEARAPTQPTLPPYQRPPQNSPLHAPSTPLQGRPQRSTTAPLSHIPALAMVRLGSGGEGVGERRRQQCPVGGRLLCYIPGRSEEGVCAKEGRDTLPLPSAGAVQPLSTNPPHSTTSPSHTYSPPPPSPMPP